MQNYIIISRTFAETTPESIEDGDYSETGFISEHEEVSFRELVKLMKQHHHPSKFPNDGGTGVWYSTEFETEDYATGTERQESIHFDPENAENVAKYWKWAAKFAGHKIKEG